MKISILFAFTFFLLMFASCCDDCNCPDSTEENFWLEKMCDYTISNSSVRNNGDVIIVSTNGIRMSTDGGKTWPDFNPFSPRAPILSEISFHFISNGDIFACSNVGIFRSLDNSATWSLVQGLPDNIAYNCIEEYRNGVIFAGSSQGIFISKDMGTTWDSSSVSADGKVEVSTILAYNLEMPIAGSSKGVFAFVGGSESWEYLGFNGKVESMTVCDSSIIVESAGYLYRCSDFLEGFYGNKWKKIYYAENSRKITCLITTPTKTIYAGTNGDGVYESKDMGEHWKLVNSGLIDKYSFSIRSISFSSGGFLFAGTTGGLYKSKKIF